MPIEIVADKLPKKKIKPHYLLEFEYTIGDADGDTSFDAEISFDNPYLEPLLKALDKLRPTHGYWGISFERDRLQAHFDEGHITKDEHRLIYQAMNFEYMDEDDEFYEDFEDDDPRGEFRELFHSDTEYSFLTYDCYDLQYVDEYGRKHKTRIK